MKSLRDFKPYEVIYVDAMNLLTRSYHGMRNLEYRGKKTGMLYGVARFYLDWLRKAPKAEIVFLWEGKNSWRKVKYPIYKAHRGEERDSAERQEFWDCVERVKSALPSMGIQQAWCNTYEADDVVGTIARHQVALYGSADDTLLRMLFSSGDWDWWELADYGDILYQHRDILTREDMAKRFEKKFNCSPVPPNRLWLFKVLTGDPSDNVSGIPRFPKKLASRLCALETVDEGSIIHGLIYLGERNWAEKVAQNKWIIERNLELVRTSLVPIKSIEWIAGMYSSEEVGEILLKSGMETLYDRFKEAM